MAQELAISQQVSLPRSVENSLRTETNDDYDVVGFRLDGPIHRNDLAAAIHALEAWFAARLPEREIMDGLGRLRLMTGARGMDQADMTAQIGVYANELAKYPAKAVGHVLQTQPDKSQWWPAWHEIKERLDEYSHDNRLKLEALTDRRDGVTRYPGPRPREEIPEDERNEIAGKLAKLVSDLGAEKCLPKVNSPRESRSRSTAYEAGLIARHRVVTRAIEAIEGVL